MASTASSSTAHPTDSPKLTGRFWIISVAIGLALLAVSRLSINDEVLQIGGVMLVVTGSMAFACAPEPPSRRTVSSKDPVPVEA